MVGIFILYWYNMIKFRFTESLIKPDILSYVNLLETNLQTDQDLYLEYKQRLLNIREKKAQSDLYNDDENQMDVDESDLISDTTSMRSSQYTSSSKGTG